MRNRLHLYGNWLLVTVLEKFISKSHISSSDLFLKILSKVISFKVISFKGIAKSYKFWLESWRNYKYVTLAWNNLSSQSSFNSDPSSLSIILSFNLSFNLFFQNFLVSSSLHLSKSFCSRLSLSRKFLCSKTCAIHLFHSLLPLQKRILQGLISWILFVSLFSLFQKNEGLTAWILLCLPSLLSKNSKRHSLRILLILPFPINKRLQKTNRLRTLS